MARSTALLAVAAFAASAACAAPAVATAAPTTSRSLEVAVPTMGGWSAGTATLSVDYAGDRATARIAAPSILLGPGKQYRLTSCIKASTTYVGYDNRCARREIDQRAAAAVEAFAAPTATATVTRPTRSGRPGYAQALVLVEEARSTAWVAVAGTPTAELVDAALPLTAADGTSAPLPDTGGVRFAAGMERVGGVDSGYPDSFCAGIPDDRVTAPPAGVTAGALGSGAPAYHEVGEPTRDAPGGRARGVMLLVHGGGWFAVGGARAIRMRAEADRWRARGWRTVVLAYRPCGQSLHDVLRFHDRVVDRYGAAVPVCLSGGSAGGQLALAVAVWRPSVACVAAHGAPTDATTLPNERAYDPADPTGPGQTEGPRWIVNLMAAAWGLDQLPWHSPARWPVRARVLATLAEQDPFVPWTQVTGLRDRMLAQDPNAYIDAYRLPAGPVDYVHGRVSADAVDELHRREERLVQGLRPRPVSGS